MYKVEDLLSQLISMNIDEDKAIIVHASMKSIGDVKGRADPVLDALSGVMKQGLLIFPTHT